MTSSETSQVSGQESSNQSNCQNMNRQSGCVSSKSAGGWANRGVYITAGYGVLFDETVIKPLK